VGGDLLDEFFAIHVVHTTASVVSNAASSAARTLLVCCVSKRPLWRELILADQDRLIGDDSRR
jgi:hypothetical protein